MKYSFLAIMFMFFICHNTSNTRVEFTNIDDIEIFDDSLVLIKNHDSAVAGEKLVLRLNLNNMEIDTLEVLNFDGRIINIISVTDSTFTYEISYDIETEYYGFVLRIDGSKQKINEEDLSKIEIQEKKFKLEVERVKKNIDANIWKIIRLESYSIMLINNWKNAEKYYVIKSTNNAKNIEVLYESNNKISICSDTKKLYLIKDQELVISAF